MISGFFSLIYRIAFLAIIVFICTAAYIVYDGLNDRGTQADVAVVPGNAVLRDGMPGSILRERLDRAIELYRARDFPMIIVSGATKVGGYDEPTVMADYLVAHDVPRDDILADRGGVNTDATGLGVARIMHNRGMKSVMVVTNYYHIARTKLALSHAGVPQIDQAHAGVADVNDAMMVGREVIALYYYLGRFYLVPALQNARQEAQSGGTDAKAEAKKMKDKVNDDLDSLKK